MKRIFISRDLKQDSPLHEVIGDQNTIVSQSLIEFSPLEFTQPSADWIFFYSRNGVKYFFENNNYALYPYLWACMSHGTADELSRYVTDISFIGNGLPKDVAEQFMNQIDANATTCFIRAEHSIDSIRSLIGKEQDFSLAVYRNTKKEDIPKGDFDIVLFTSPLNVDAWFSQRKYSQEKVIVIGSTTAKRTEKYGIEEITVAENPSEKSLADCLRAFI